MSENQPEIGISQRSSTTNMAEVDASHTVQIGKFYANHGQGVATLFEVRLDFGSVRANPEGTGVISDERLTVMMAPELAAMLHSLLGRTIKSYVETYGPLRLSQPQSSATPQEPRPE